MGRREAWRSGSVLVLVMTLLAILFVLGVAFLATMNFEADSIASEKQRAQNQVGTDAVMDAMGQVLREGFMTDDQVPFGDEPVDASVTGFATLPGWHNTSSPLEPYDTGAVDPVTGDPIFAYAWMTDPQSAARKPYAGPMLLAADINTDWVDGQIGVSVPAYTRVCLGGGNNGNPCVNDLGCPGDRQAWCRQAVCEGGANHGKHCTADSDCPGRGPAKCDGGTCFGGDRDLQVCDPTDPNACPGTNSATNTAAVCRLPLNDFQLVCPAGPNEGLPCYTDANCGCNDPNCPAEQLCYVCIGGANDGKPCAPAADLDCPDGRCGQPIVPVDADGDGVVDSIEVDARRMGFSPSQIAEISTAVNPPTKKDGNVFVGLRIVPHGGMVNLNASHPKLIETLLHVPPLDAPQDPNYGNFYHRPTLADPFEAYSSAVEEPLLRRRNLLPSRRLPPSRLLGGGRQVSALLVARPNTDGDMPQQLLPYNLRWQDYESPMETSDGRPGHRYWPFAKYVDPRGVLAFEPSIPGDASSPPLWRSRLEPFSARLVAQGIGRIPNAAYDGYDYREYDKRHLVTTVGHDDLLSRGGVVFTPSGSKDIREAMIEANWTKPDACEPGNLLPFEYADYPTDLSNATKPGALDDDLCDCPSKTSCVPDRRKGRLQLSLAWLDYAFDPDTTRRPPADNLIHVEQRDRLIYDAFMMLLNNASGAAWDGKCRFASAGALGGDCLPWEECVTLGIADQGTCVDRVLNQPHRLAMISRTAASLTANMIDYMDSDDTPTRIALRSFDFSEGAVCYFGPPLAPVKSTVPCPNGPSDCYDPNRTTAHDGDCRSQNAVCLDGVNAGLPCTLGDAECPGSHCVTPTVGREFNLSPSTPATPKYVYVYGLERQPFITEVVAGYSGANSFDARGVELFNPFDTAIELDKYAFIEVDAAGVPQSRISVPGGTTIGPRRFMAFVSDATGNSVLGGLAGSTTNDGSVYSPPFAAPSDFKFKKDWRLYLVRSVDYKELDGTDAMVDIVADQFTVTVGEDALAPSPPLPASAPYFLWQQRPASVARPWTAPIPVIKDNSGELLVSGIQLPHTLAESNAFASDPASATVHNVELFFADTDRLTEPLNPPGGDYSTAFPTTGSLLLLPRHANRSFGDLTPPPPHGGVALTFDNLKDLAFTTWLGRSYWAFDVNRMTGALVPQASVLEIEQVDNGRIPIFDIGTKGVPFGSDPVFYSAHHVPARQTASGAFTIGRAGELANLPWGQLVFDYFTALPLRNPGPYRTDGLTIQKAAAESQPQVDLGGLRVHGRVDLNAAPWTVMRGLPFIPTAWLPQSIRTRVEARIVPQFYDVQNESRTNVAIPEDAGIVFDERAQGIVAYREAREAVPASVSGGAFGTGHYSTPLKGRGWTDAVPAFRRGMGFLTVGELANVRFDDGAGMTPPANGAYRMDAGVVQRDLTAAGSTPYAATDHDYLEAAATLIALGDWVTVRSQVATVFGVIRGEEDDTIVDPDRVKQDRLRRQDLQSRSLRFQETLDRLPTFLGSQRPARIGERIIAKYRDFQSD